MNQTRIKLTLAFSLLLGGISFVQAKKVPNKLSVQIGGALFSLEVAQTPQSLQKGLMERAILPDQTGMLFLFPTLTKRCFWMKKTLIPLDLLFINPQGQIIEIIENLHPGSLEHRCSSVAVRAAIEVPSGTVKRHHLVRGMLLHGLENRTLNQNGEN